MYRQKQHLSFNVEATLESAITNNIPEATARKHNSTCEDMFTEWIERFRAHVLGTCEFTVDQTFEPKSRVRGTWDSLSELVKEISPEVFKRSQRALIFLSEEQATRRTKK